MDGTPTHYSVTSPMPTGVSSASLISSPLKSFLTGDWVWPTSPAPPLDSLAAYVLKVGHYHNLVIDLIFKFLDFFFFVYSALTNFNGAPITTANVGISSLYNEGRRLLLAEAILITAHEIGERYNFYGVGVVEWCLNSWFPRRPSI